MKKIFAMVISVILAFSSLGVTAFAATEETTAKSGMITIDSKNVKAGEDFSVAVNITENPGIFGMTVAVVFDKNAIIYKNATQDGKVFDEDGEIIVNDSYKTDGKIIISPLINGYEKDCSKTGKLITLNFKANDKAKNGSYSITPSIFLDGQNDGSAFNVDGVMVPFKFSSGVVTIGGGAKADGNSKDGDLSANDNNGSSDDGAQAVTNENGEKIDSSNDQTESGVEIGGTAKNEANSQGSAIPWIIVGVLVVVVAAVAVMIVVSKKKKSDLKTDESDKTNKQ